MRAYAFGGGGSGDVLGEIGARTTAAAIISRKDDTCAALGSTAEVNVTEHDAIAWQHSGDVGISHGGRPDGAATW